MLSPEQIKENKEKFLNIVKEITIEGADIDGLIKMLEGSDFFEAPASTRFHCGYKGGLCEHSLNVYENLCGLVSVYAPGKFFDDSLRVVALFHDLSKMNFYESYIQKKKVYSQSGKQYDKMGNYDWVSEEAFKIKDDSQRFVAGDHGFNSVMLLSRYIPLTEEESVSILNHMMGMDNKYMNPDLSAIANRYTLLTLLHTADFLATYINERM